MRTSRTIGTLVACAAMLAPSGCATKGAEASTPGVTDDTITLGALIDLSGPFSGSGKMTLAGTKLALAEANADGGVCDRKLELEVRDHGYDVQKGVVGYGEIEPEVLAIRSVYGSSIVSALRDRIHQDQMLVAPTSFSGALLGDRNLIILGATFAVMAINGLDYLQRHDSIAAGDSIGHLYLEGELGEDSLEGSQFFADRHDMTVVPREIGLTDTDFRGQVQDFKRAGVSAIIAEATPTQVATAASAAQSIGLDVPIISGPQGFANSLLETNAGQVLQDNYLKMGGVAPMGTENPQMGRLREMFAKTDAAEEGEPESATGVVDAYVMTNAFLDIIKSSCDNLTREGLLEARENMTTFTAPGMAPPQDFSDSSVPASAQSNVQAVTPDAYSGVVTREDFRASKTALEYVAQLDRK
jgi:ABC-type branched-subunit amino acid transport system substrate-binding protein